MRARWSARRADGWRAFDDAMGSEKREKKEKKEKKEKREKKEKKEKREREDDDREARGEKRSKSEATGATKFANVGDRALATSSSAFQRVFYRAPKHLSSMSVKEVEAAREKLAITQVEGLEVDLAPVGTFEDAGFSKELLKVTAQFQNPSPIQAQSWPIIMSGRDMVGIAATGSGKTLAFGMPALTQIRSQPPCKPGQPICLVLAPTRELAQQTAKVFDDAGEASGVRCVCVYGGAPKHEQKAAMKAGGGAAVIVATPGRLRDFMEEGVIKLDRVTMLVLDEADRMLDLGFEPEIRAIAGATRADRQTVMFSATWPQSVQSLASEFMCDPVRVRIGAEGLKASQSVTQVVEVVEPQDKDRHLARVMKQYLGNAKEVPRTLIFGLYKKECANLHQRLARDWPAVCIHGDMSQADRERSVEAFKKGTSRILIATDVAARGLDIKGVEYVINYTFPLTTEDYVHRIGRTGRAGATGLAHTFFTVHDKARAGELVNVLRKAGADVPEELTKFGTHVKKKESKLYGAHFKDVDMSVKATKITFD